ncbi:hypothetical protein [Nocardia sp. NPDC050435]|uniref:hypothetical protein n=1 Tax=Nocardia sp. NPDC050435 TaxID=3155040 RepID=UPI0033DE1BF2
MTTRRDIEALAIEHGWELGTKQTGDGWDRVGSRPTFDRDRNEIEVDWTDSGQIYYAKNWETGDVIRYHHRGKRQTMTKWLAADRSPRE